MGMLTDRFGGRAIFAVLMAAVAMPVWLVPEQTTFRPAGRRVLAGTRRIVVRDRRRLRLALDAARTPGQRARRLRPGQHRPVGGRVPGPGDRRAASGWTPCSRRRGHARGLGRRLLPARAQRSRASRDPARASASMLAVLATRATLVGAVRLLLPDLRRLRRVLDLPADAAARTKFRLCAGRRRLPHRRLRGAGHAAASGRRLALGPHRRRARAVRAFSSAWRRSRCC